MAYLILSYSSSKVLQFQFVVLVLFGLNPTKRKFVFSPDVPSVDKNDERKVFVYFHFVSFI